jgi:hypothetical protein
MLLLPVLAAMTVTGPRPLHLPLVAATLAAYPLSYFLLQAVKTGRLRRVRPQLTAYGVATVLCAAPVLAARPAVLAYAPLYGVLAAVNAGYARRSGRRRRSPWSSRRCWPGPPCCRDAGSRRSGWDWSRRRAPCWCWRR